MASESARRRRAAPGKIAIVLERQLTVDERGPAAVAILEELEEIPAL